MIKNVPGSHHRRVYSRHIVRFFVKISNLCHEIENGNGNGDTNVYHYEHGTAITC